MRHPLPELTPRGMDAGPAVHAPFAAPHPPPSTIKPRSSGFSLLEVLVATTVLIIIVMIVAMVFQQSTGAWAGGTRKANVAMTLRSLLGQMQRELLEAVDARAFTNALGVSGRAAVVNAADARFVVLRRDPAEATGARVPCRIVYVFDGRYVERLYQKLHYSAGTWQNDGPSENTVLNSSHPLVGFEMTAVPGPDPNGLPLRVDIEARVAGTNRVLLVSGRSAGRDKVLGTPDDIVAGR